MKERISLPRGWDARIDLDRFVPGGL